MKTGEDIHAGSRGAYESYGKTGEVLTRDEAREVGEKTLTVVNQAGENVGGYEETLGKATDRNGNPLYSQETIRRMVAEARKAGEAREVEISPVGKELDAVGVEGFEVTDAKMKIAKLEAALLLMDGDPVTQAGLQRRIEELRAQMEVRAEDLENGFAKSEGETGSQGEMAVKYAEKLAENAGRIEGDGWMDPKERAQMEAAEAEIAEEEERQEELREKMKALVDEVRNERGGEVMLSPEDRSVVVENVQKKMGGGWLKGLRRLGVKVAAGLMVFATVSGLTMLRSDASSYTKTPIAQERSFDAMGMARGAAAQMVQQVSGVEGVERRNGPTTLDVWGETSEAESTAEGLSEAQMLAKGRAIIEAEAIANRPGNYYHENGVFENMSEYNSDQKSSLNAFAESREWIYDLDDVGNRNGEAINQIIIVCRDNPGVLASHTAFFPNVLKAAGISDEVINIKDPEVRANAVYREMMGENGGDVQKKLLGGLLTVLQDENTSFQYMLTNGVNRTFFEPTIDQGEDANAENLTLRTANKRRNNAKQVLITIRDKDENGQIVEYKLQLNLYCGFQPDMEALKTVAKKKTQKISEVVTETVVPEEKTVEEEIVVVTETPTVIYHSNGGGGNSGGGGGSERPGPGTNGGTEEQPGGTEEKPGGEEEPGGNPGGPGEVEKPDEGPKEEPPKEETVKPKDGENQKKVVAEGGQTNGVNQTQNVEVLAGQGIVTPSNESEVGAVEVDQDISDMNGTYSETSETINADGNEQVVGSQQVADQNVSQEQQREDQQNQETANSSERLESMTDQEVLDEVSEYLSQSNEMSVSESEPEPEAQASENTEQSNEQQSEERSEDGDNSAAQDNGNGGEQDNGGSGEQDSGSEQVDSDAGAETEATQ